MATIVHFGISADDPERARKFYATLFGWHIRLLPGPVQYYLIATQDLNGAAGVGGGMTKGDDFTLPGIINYMGVASVDESTSLVVKLGGKVLRPKQAVPGWGFLAVCMDTEGNVFGLFQEDSKAAKPL